MIVKIKSYIHIKRERKVDLQMLEKQKETQNKEQKYNDNMILDYWRGK